MINEEKQAAILAGMAAPKQPSQSVFYGNLDDIASQFVGDYDLEKIQEAFEKTIPLSAADLGQIGNEPIFRLCRKLKGLLPDISSDKLLIELKPLFENWFSRAVPVFKMVNGGIESFDDYRIQISYILDNRKVKCPDLDYIPTAVSNATKWYGSPRPEMAWCTDPKILFLAAICFELQSLLGKGYFWLSQYDAEKITGKQARQCGFILDDFCRRKILVKIKSGDRRPGGKANEYHYIDGDFNGQSDIPRETSEDTPTDIQDL